MNGEQMISRREIADALVQAGVLSAIEDPQTGRLHYTYTLTGTRTRMYPADCADTQEGAARP